ncbi:nicotinate-nucleotide-dimethylbenzimidazole phosphoribosyltransferase [Granulicella pectinivorans]|uniref:Nicotinate-nucleotide--dimethylbenzimidazole phosphoribosyltransferase n=1 Tax=Granulicella pectinivorans TaxID=474950 RepID=A0A1I6MY17_9BACT|nr:nicotinate-nucleotide--dimethylbenzimidazole phosphoribosyltransferase [Granulicella pectinivorans]SFS20559.1 nicotinate-nucleotide-dimethylbenzimidazole phosphoribosyltransferase [Granulicella pectinivorans]
MAVSEVWRAKARARLDTLTKPLGSLGRLEDVAAQVAAIRQEKAMEPMRAAVYCFAADHGVTAEGVSAYPSEVTRQMVLNFVGGGAAINVLARLHGVALTVVDVGVDGEFEGIAGMVHAKVRRGSRNMRREAAMSAAEMAAAMDVGARMAAEAAAAGFGMVAAGEMGIGNTTAASAMTAALTGVGADVVTGSGTGVGSVQRSRKVTVVEETLAAHFGIGGSVERPSCTQILECVGGLEIAAMAGFYLGAARAGLVVVCDGFIATAAAAIAVGMEPEVAGYLIAGHKSEEPGHAVLLEHLGLRPLLDLGMRLGEGTGAVLAMPVIASAMALYGQMATFGDAGVSEAGA